jgi:microcystin-dependent protein
MAWFKEGNIQGPQGEHGLAYTTTTAPFTVPAVGATVDADVLDASWMVVGEVVWVALAGGTQAAALKVTAINGNTITLLNPVPVSAAGLPAGGLINELLYKRSSADVDAGWTGEIDIKRLQTHDATSLPTLLADMFNGSPALWLGHDSTDSDITNYAVMFDPAGLAVNSKAGSIWLCINNVTQLEVRETGIICTPPITGQGTVPAGGTTGQVPTKLTAADYDVDWQTPPALANAVLTGTVFDFAGAAAPAGYLLCDGAAVSRATYATLYSVLGGASSPWGQGDGTSTFNVPDLRGRVTLGSGQGSALTNRLLAAKGGEELHGLSVDELASHTHVQDAHNHVQDAHNHADAGHNHAQAAHNHTQNAHTHTPSTGAGDSFRVYVGSGGSGASSAGTIISQQAVTGATVATNNAATATNIASTCGLAAATALNQVATATNQNTGNGAGHNTMPPFAVLNKIIKI